MTIGARIQLRRDTSANWTSNNPTLFQGEPAFETDTGRQKVGDGTSAWIALPYSPAQLIRTSVKTANYTLLPWDLAVFDTTSGSLIATLPTAPPDKTQVALKMITQVGTNTVTYNCGGSDVINKASGATSGTLKLLAQLVILEYQSSTSIWTVLNDDMPLAQLDLRYAGITSGVGGSLAGNLPNPTLTSVGPGPTGPLGSATVVPVVTINAEGRVTGLTSIAIAIPESAVTNLTTDLAAKAPIASPTFTGTATAPEFSASGVTGAVAASRYVGGTTTGAPSTGTFAVGDFVITQDAHIFICTSAGTPGTWVTVKAPPPTAATTSFAAAISAGVQNTLGYDIVVTGTIDYTAALAGATFTIGVGSGSSPTLVAFATISVAGAGQSYFSAKVPANYYLGLGTTGTITAGTITAAAIAS